MMILFYIPKSASDVPRAAEALRLATPFRGRGGERDRGGAWRVYGHDPGRRLARQLL